jgi:hypothetical protein
VSRAQQVLEHHSAAGCMPHPLADDAVENPHPCFAT